MNCAYCGQWLIHSTDRIVHLIRFRPLSPVVHDNPETSPPSGTIEPDIVCSRKCAELLRQRWQNDDLADDIVRATHGPSTAVSAITQLISIHRAKWARQEDNVLAR